MYKWFLSHQWKEMTRSNFWQKSLVINIIIGFFMLIMFSYLVLLGLFIDKILIDINPKGDVFAMFNGGLLYYLGVDLFVRFFMYSLPVINIESYLHLPIQKSKILNFLLLKSSLNIFNILPLLMFIPFAFKVVVVGYSGNIALSWMILMVILILNNSFLLHYLKRRFIDKPAIIGIFALILVSAMLLDKFNIIALSEFSSQMFVFLAYNPLYIIFPLILLILIYGINFSYLKSRMTLEDVNVKKQKKIDSLSRIKYFDSFGDLGEMILLEMKLVWRNKRCRSVINMSPIFLLYGFFFYPQDIYLEGFGFLIFVGVFMTGGIMFNYGQYMLSWESNYFDGILAHNVDFQKHFRAKYIMIISTVIISYILTIPYVFFGTKVLIINTATFLFNLGFLSFLLMYFSSNSRKRMDMTKSSAFNYQGLGATNWIMILPFFLLPIIIWLPFNLFGLPYMGIGVIGGIGVVSLAFHKSLMKIIVKRFEEKKHAIAEGFREL
ncbi:MAG: hypothetical protein KOO66_03850 [Bacteroidales bacterium]|nr:hypothetical protein [Bacteroidales bacterium]